MLEDREDLYKSPDPKGKFAIWRNLNGEYEMLPFDHYLQSRREEENFFTSSSTAIDDDEKIDEGRRGGAPAPVAAKQASFTRSKTAVL